MPPTTLSVQCGNGEESGRLVNVTGNSMNGITYEIIETAQPKSSPTIIDRKRLGWVLSSDLDGMESICRGCPAPGKQFDGV